MSDYSISAMSVSSIAFENQASGAESVPDFTSTLGSGLNEGGADTMEQIVAGSEVASKTTEFYGNGTDLSSTGTDVDIAQAINSTLGMITDKVV